MAKKRKRRQHYQEKPRMCDPGMCDHYQYIGEGDFICDDAPEGPVIVVDGWEPTENYLRCRNKGSRNE